MSAEQAIRHSLNNDTERLGELFAGSYEAEGLIVSALPALIGGCIALAGAAFVTARQFALVDVVPWVIAAASVLAMRHATRSAAARTADEETRRGNDATALLELCFRATGEFGRGASGEQLITRVGDAAASWAHAESRRESVYRIRRIALIAAMVGVGLLLTLAFGGHPERWLAHGASSVRHAWPLILIPLTYSVAQNIDVASHAARAIAIAMQGHDPRESSASHRFPSGEHVRAKHLVVRFGDSVALDDVSVEFASRGVTVIVGPNAAGKSTLARAIAGIVVPSSGELSIGNVPCVSISADDVAYLPQHPAWLPARSVLDNVRFGAPDARRDDVEQMLKRLDVIATVDRPIATLSGGQQRRVSVARALLRDPRLLVLDEADAGLDRNAREWLAGVVRDESAERSIVVVTHHPALFAFADRVLVLDERHQLVDCGSPSVLERRCAAYRALLRADEAFGSSGVDSALTA